MNRDETLRIVPLGGLGEIGINLMVIEVRREAEVEAAVAIDCGVMFPTFETPGVDLILPDFTHLRDLGDRLLGVVLTHGHEDHIGGLPFLLRERPVTVWGSPFALSLVRRRLEDAAAADLRTFEPGDRIPIGPFTIEPVRVTHSIPDSVALAIETPIGTVVHTGDFKIDHTPVDARPSDLARLAEIGRSGVRLLMSDSTNATRAGVTPSELEVGRGLRHLFARARGRIVAVTFASHVHRIQQLVDLGGEAGRSVALVGRNLVEKAELARRLGHLRAADPVFVDADDAGELPDRKAVLVVTGSQGEPGSVLARLAAGEHPRIRLGEGDVVILSARVIPGNERVVGSLVDRLVRRGVEVHWGEEPGIHCSGHGSAEDLRLMLRLLRPRAFVPVHGEYRHLVRHREIAVETGVGARRSLVLEDGDSLELDREREWRGEAVPATRVFVDGKGVGDVEPDVLRDRRRLERDGVVVAVVGISRASGEISHGPEILTRGVIGETARDGHLERASRAVREALGEEIGAPFDTELAREILRRTLKRFFDKELGRWPMIFPVILEM